MRMSIQNRLIAGLPWLILLFFFWSSPRHFAESKTRNVAPRALLPYQDPSLNIKERVADLVSRMTLEEKVSQLVNDSKAVSRLEVAAYNWWSECLHGVAFAGIATVFPQAIGLGAMWDAPFLERVAEAISDEARAKHHEAINHNRWDTYIGLTFWSPNINIFRDPRWGRGQETYGEDPYLTARLGVAFVRGLQGNDPRYLKVVSTPKHYAVHSGPEPERHQFDALASERDIRDTYLPAFEASVREGGAFSVMSAYNRVNGEACSSHSQLLERILRLEWGFAGYVVSDCDAVADIYTGHHLVNSLEEAAAMGLRGGCDLNCGSTYLTLVDAVHHRLITEPEIDRSLGRLLEARFRLGMFDPDSMVAYAQIPFSVNDSPEHRQLALQAARESLVLLKNSEGVLPLRKDLASLAVIGPNADVLEVLLGNYNGWPSKAVTPLEGIRAKVSSGTRVLYFQGSELTQEPAPIPGTALFHQGGSDFQPGLMGEYFPNRSLSGTPVLTRTDARVDFEWWGSPANGIPADNFSVRWTGKLKVPVSGLYQLGVSGDDGFRLYLDGQLLVADWADHAARTLMKEVTLEAGRYYDLRVEFYESLVIASIKLLWQPPRGTFLNQALETARQADAVVLVLGLSSKLEGEEMSLEIEGFQRGDRTDLGLPDVQEELLQAVQGLGKPTVLVLLSGSALAVNWADSQVDAILQAWYPGEEGGTAIAEALFGDYNPGGRLPVTFYKGVEQLPAFEDYRMAGRTYRYFSGAPLYPFGFGLSYTRFGYSNLKLSSDRVAKGENLSISVDVQNTGAKAGDEVVQLYLTDLQASEPVPILSLQGFTRISLSPGEQKTVHFALTPRQMSLVNEVGFPVLEPGDFRLTVGGKQPGFAGSADAGTTEVLSTTFRVVSERSGYQRPLEGRRSRSIQ
jgi:beta-glucosidase